MAIKYRKKALIVDLLMWTGLIVLLSTGHIKEGVLFFLAGVSFEFLVYPAILKARRQKEWAKMESELEDYDYEEERYDDESA